MTDYKWGFQLAERGFVAIPPQEMTEGQKKKDNYVRTYLSPSISHANCGWIGAEYYVMKDKNGNCEEYAKIVASDASGRYVNVSGNSLGAIAEAVWNNIW